MSLMPKITLSDLAPADAKHFSLANAEFDVPFESDDPEVVSNANAHPWLKVEFDAVASKPVFLDNTIVEAPSVANDPKAVADELARRRGEEASDPVAIDAGLDQDKKVTEDGTDLTLAAADAAAPTSKKGKE